MLICLNLVVCTKFPFFNFCFQSELVYLKKKKKKDSVQLFAKTQVRYNYLLVVPSALGRDHAWSLGKLNGTSKVVFPWKFTLLSFDLQLYHLTLLHLLLILNATCSLSVLFNLTKLQGNCAEAISEVSTWVFSFALLLAAAPKESPVSTASLLQCKMQEFAFLARIIGVNFSSNPLQRLL